MDAIKAAFESQFGTEWSAPVTNSAPTNENESENDNDLDLNSSNSSDEGVSSQSESDEGPITIKHDEQNLSSTQPAKTKAQKRKFMSSTAPKDDTQLMGAVDGTDEKGEDLKNDIALQRLIEESHILHEAQQFTGADISAATDPLETVGKSRLKVMNARLAKAGAKTKNARIPQAMAVGIKNKKIERTQKYKEEARNAGIILAKEKHTKSKNRTRDTGLKINSVGKASEYGIHVSKAEIERLTSSRKPKKGKYKARR